MHEWRIIVRGEYNAFSPGLIIGDVSRVEHTEHRLVYDYDKATDTMQRILRAEYEYTSRRGEMATAVIININDYENLIMECARGLGTLDFSRNLYKNCQIIISTVEDSQPMFIKIDPAEQYKDLLEERYNK